MSEFTRSDREFYSDYEWLQLEPCIKRDIEEGINPWGKYGCKAKGFAANPDKINRDGRPKNSRNKSTLIKAQLQIDSWAEMAVEGLIALAQNDKDKLNSSSDVPYSVRIAAYKELLGKAVANEKDKLGEGKDSKDKEGAEEDMTPIISRVPLKGVE